jgi:hypothetical protein
MSVVDGKLCGLQKEELLRFLLSEKFFFGALLEQLDSEEVDGVEDLGLLDLERCFEQVTACKIRKALDSQEKGLYASESRASPAARDPSAEAATPPAHAQNTEEPQWLADAAAMLAPAGACPASPTRARPAAREDEVTPPAAPSKQAARRDLARRGVVRRVQFTDEGVVRPQAATRLQAAWRRWVAQHCYNRLRSWPTCGMRRRVAAEAIETAYAIPPGCCMPAGMRRALVRDHAARVVQNAYLLGVEQGSWGRVRRRRAWESRRVGEEIILSYWMRSSSATMDLGFLCFQEGFIEAVWRIQAVWRGTRVRAAAVGVAGRAPLRGFDAHAAGAFFAARWAAATAQGSTAVIYNAAPAEGDNKQAVPQARGDEKQSDAETAPQLRVARSEAGGDSDADAACLPKPTQSSPLPQPTSGRGRGQPAAGQTPTSSADPSATRRPFLLSMSAGLVRSHISGIRDGARVFRWEHYELLEAYDAWLRGGTVEASWDGEDCLTGGMYSGCGPQCDAGWINWIFWKLYFDSTIDVRRPCGSQHRAFAACGWREGPASAGAVLSLMMQHESALTVRAARAGGMPFPTWEFDDEGDSEDGESAGSDEVDSDDSDLGGVSHDGDHVQ